MAMTESDRIPVRFAASPLPNAEYARDRSGLGSAHARMPIIRFCARCCGDEGGR
jgi:hypothetical protein